MNGNSLEGTIGEQGLVAIAPAPAAERLTKLIMEALDKKAPPYAYDNSFDQLTNIIKETLERELERPPS